MSKNNLLFILVLFETRGIYLTKEVYFSQFTEKWYDVTDYEMLSAGKNYNEMLGPLFFFNSKYCATSIYMCKQLCLCCFFKNKMKMTVVMQGTNFTAHTCKPHPYMLMYAFNEGLLLRPVLVALYK